MAGASDGGIHVTSSADIGSPLSIALGPDWMQTKPEGGGASGSDTEEEDNDVGSRLDHAGNPRARQAARTKVAMRQARVENTQAVAAARATAVRKKREQREALLHKARR